MTTDLGHCADEAGERLRSLESTLNGTRGGWSGDSRQIFDDQYVEPLLSVARRWNAALDEAASEIRQALAVLG
jgi:uncharacterized protein YukE